MRTDFSFLLFSLYVLFTSSLLTAQVAAPCEEGFAGVYPCNDYDLVSRMSVAELGGSGSANDIWGWTDLQDGKEYAIVGLTDGTAFVDISIPNSPVLLGNLPTHTSNSPWRDVKVYSNHAFIVSEAGGHGMQVFDLTRLRNVVAPPVIFTNDAHYAGFGNAHNIVINEASGYAYGVGSSANSGGLHFIDISNPTSPSIAGGFSADGYTHDAQVVNYIGPDGDHQGKEIAFASNEDTFTIIDVSDKTDPAQLSRTGYSNSAYTHQGWATEDHRYFLMNDELDEQGQGHNTRTRIWDIQDLDSPTLIGFYDGPTSAIDHNLYTKGDLAFESNYRAGLRVLDISDIANANLSEVGYFDVYPTNDNANFNGTWSNYPYFNSGNIIISSIEGGLFIVHQSVPQPCPAPSALNATNITGTGALLSWTDNALNSNGFEVEVVPSGDTPSQSGVLVSGTSFLFDSGTSSTSYDFYVQTDCFPIDYSFWSGPYTFTTASDFCGNDSFVDSGGATGNYSDNENETYTICPNEVGGSISMTFTVFNVEGRSDFDCWDNFFVFDGSSTAAPAVTPESLGLGLGTEGFCNTAGSLAGETLVSNNPSGCLTFQFVSDVSVVLDGWEAQVTCIPAPGPDCSLYETAPVDLTKSLQPVPYPDGVIDRVQVKWYKDSPQVKYTAADSSAVDIQFWAVRNLATNTPIVGADTSLIEKRTKTGQDFFKWPVKFERSDVNPNTRYKWRVRTYCQEGDGPASPWSDIKIFNTPDFDPGTGIYTPLAEFNVQSRSMTLDESGLGMSIFPNPNDGQFDIRFKNTIENAVLEIFDVRGVRVVYQQLVDLQSGTRLNSESLLHLESGWYLVSVRSEDQVEHHSMICR